MDGPYNLYSATTFVGSFQGDEQLFLDQDVGTPTYTNLSSSNLNQSSGLNQYESSADLNQSLAIDSTHCSVPTSRSGGLCVSFFLKNDIDGREILQNYSVNSNLTDAARNLLCRRIAKKLLDDGNQSAKKIDFPAIVDQIIEIFPSEFRGTYYVPYIYNADTKKKINPGGKLFNAFLNEKKKKPAARAIKRHRSSSEVEEAINQNPSPNSDRPIEFLKKYLEPLDQIQKYWQESYDAREIFKKKMSITEYLKLFPIMSTEIGKELLEADFSTKYKNNKFKFEDNYRRYKEFLFKTLKEKVAASVDSKVLIELYETCTENAQNFIIFTLLTHLFQNSNPFIVEGNRKKRRPSVIEVKNAFYLHVKNPADINCVIEERRKQCVDRGITFQPCILVTGQISAIESCYLLIDNCRYTCEDFLSAVKYTFYSFFTLNAEYPTDCIAVWTFIQLGLFEISTKFDRPSVAISSLIGMLKNYK